MKQGQKINKYKGHKSISDLHCQIWISILCASEFPVLCKIIDWNFSGLTIILFYLNQSTVFADSFSKVVNIASFSFEIEEIVFIAK